MGSGEVMNAEANSSGSDVTCDPEPAVCEDVDLSDCIRSNSNTDGESSCDDRQSVDEEPGNRTSFILR